MARGQNLDGTSLLGRAARVAGIYALLGGLWILLSDRAVDALVVDPEVALRVQSAKGIAFVAFSALVIGALVLRELRARRTAEHSYRVLVEQSLVGIYVIREGRFIFANEKLAEIFGYDRQELIRRTPVSELVAAEDRDRVLDNLRRREAGEVDRMHYTFQGVRQDGSPLTVEVHGGRLQWDGAPAVMGVLVDVTQRQELQDRLRQSQRMEEMGRLTGAVAHDFKNLLTAIGTSLDLARDTLRGSEESDASVADALDELREAGDVTDRATTLTRQLLAFSRRRVRRPEPVVLNHLIREMRPLLERLTSPELRLVEELAPDLPPVNLDPGLFGQVLVNLVANADDATDGAGRVVLRTRTADAPPGSPDDAWVLLEVEDDGKGIAPEKHGRIFEPFYTTRSEGTGLGLATVHGIVEQAHGRIDVRSDVGAGATFSVVLPPAAAEAAVGDEREPPSSFAPDDPEPDGDVRGPGRRSRGEKARILVVEDEDAVLRVTVRVLVRHGYRVDSATTAAEGESLAREVKEDLDLLITDVGLPDGNGLSLADRLRPVLGRTPVLFTSGHSDDEIMERLGARKNARFLEKPYSLDELLAAVRDALDADEPDDKMSRSNG